MNNMENQEQTAIVYMVAGISSRFEGKIKQFAKVGPNEETLIEYSLNQALKAGFDKIIFIVGNKTEQLFKEKFGNTYKKIPIEYALQTYDEEKRDRPWGTGSALCAIKDIIDCPFVVCNGDDIYGEKTFKILYEHLQKSNKEATIGYNLINVLAKEGSVNRAIFEIDNENYVQEITEIFNITKDNLEEKNLKPDNLCNMNFFALRPTTVQLLNKRLEEFQEQNKDNRKIEFYLPEELANLIKQEKIKIKLYQTPDTWVGITNPGDEIIVKERLKENQ